MSRRKYLNEEGFDKWWYDMLANKGITPTNPDSASGLLAWEHQEKRIAELVKQLAEFKQTARRLVTDTHNKWAIDRLIILAGEGNE